MIITVVEPAAGQAGGGGKSLLAGRLAASRALAGRKVLLLGANPRRDWLDQSATHPAGALPHKLVVRAISAKGLQPELEHLINCYHDIVIDTEDRDSMASRSALIAARVVIVPCGAACVGAPDGGAPCVDGACLVRRIGKARMFNPGLRVLVVPVCGPAAAQEQEQEMERAQTLAARIPAAALTGIEQLYGAVFR